MNRHDFPQGAQFEICYLPISSRLLFRGLSLAQPTNEEWWSGSCKLRIKLAKDISGLKEVQDALHHPKIRLDNQSYFTSKIYNAIMRDRQVQEVASCLAP